ncbi:MAG: hypothetical protein FWF85_05565 [Clostridiales bacterium]|nr:hypothetical protein [Clostridiales bacterium]
MKPINDGNFTVAPFEFDSIEELRIEKNLNEHATLYVKGVAKKDWKILPVTDATEYTNIKCEADGNVFFSGVLRNVATTRIDDVYYLEAYAVSHTIKLDTKRHKRAFQDSGSTYRDIVEAIIGEGGGSVKYHADPQSVEKILVQYDETDWQFALRLASHTQDVLTPISVSDEPGFHFGVEDESCAGGIETANFAVFKDFNLLRSRSNDDRPLDEDSIILYKVKTDDFSYGMYDAGEKVLLNQKELYVRQAVLTLEQAVVSCLYTLAPKNAITAAKIYNTGITGLALAGIVQVVENDDLKLDLHIDYEPGTVQFFKYATDYSPESHTGWYVMPEVGDTVFLIFPTEDEKDAHAASSMRQSSTGRTGDPLIKYLRTPFGKEVKLEEKEVLLTGKDDETYIKINEDSGIEISTLKPIKVFSDETLEITSTDDMNITTEANMSIDVRKNLKINADASIEVTCQDNIIKIEPASGITANTDQEINMLSTLDTNIKTNSKMALTSNGNTILSTHKKLLGSGKKAFILNNKNNSISMEPLKGISIASDKNLNMVSRGDATIISTKGLNLSAVKDIKTSAGKKRIQSGKAAVEVSSGGSSLKTKPAGIDIKGTSIKEN